MKSAIFLFFSLLYDVLYLLVFFVLYIGCSDVPHGTFSPCCSFRYSTWDISANYHLSGISHAALLNLSKHIPFLICFDPV